MCVLRSLCARHAKDRLLDCPRKIPKPRRGPSNVWPCIHDDQLAGVDLINVPSEVDAMARFVRPLLLLFVPTPVPLSFFICNTGGRGHTTKREKQTPRHNLLIDVCFSSFCCVLPASSSFLKSAAVTGLMDPCGCDGSKPHCSELLPDAEPGVLFRFPRNAFEVSHVAKRSRARPPLN